MANETYDTDAKFGPNAELLDAPSHVFLIDCPLKCIREEDKGNRRRERRLTKLWRYRGRISILSHGGMRVEKG